MAGWLAGKAERPELALQPSLRCRVHIIAEDWSNRWRRNARAARCDRSVRYQAD